MLLLRVLLVGMPLGVPQVRGSQIPPLPPARRPWLVLLIVRIRLLTVLLLVVVLRATLPLHGRRLLA